MKKPKKNPLIANRIESQRVEVVSPRRYADLYRSEPGSIESARIVAPRLGDGTFGKIIITRKLYSVR